VVLTVNPNVGRKRQKTVLHNRSFGLTEFDFAERIS
jgi:hypothetical protein